MLEIERKKQNINNFSDIYCLLQNNIINIKYNNLSYNKKKYKFYYEILKILYNIPYKINIYER